MTLSYRIVLLLFVGAIAVVFYAGRYEGPESSADEDLVEKAGAIALGRGFDDSVRRQGPRVLWASRPRIAARCAREPFRGTVPCKVRVDQYADRDRWCVARYSVSVSANRSELSRAPTCGTYSSDGNPFPEPQNPDDPPQDPHRPPL